MASPNSSGVGYGIDKWVTDTTLNFKNNILNVKNNLMRANALVIEGNYLAQQLNANCKYAIELKIPKENIRPHFNEDPMISEVIITATLKNEKWPSFEMSVDDFETYLEKMRDFYTKRLKKDALNHDTNDLYRMFRDLTKRPTNVDERLHCLIGVAFVILKPALEQVITFTYPSPIFNRQGEIVGRLNVCLRRLVDNKCSPESSLSVQIRIRDATDLPFHLTNNVFCQYTFFDEAEPTIVKSQHQSSSERAIRFSNKSMIMFNHKNIFRLLDKEKIARFNRLAENGGVFSLQVYGHAMNSPQTKSRTPSNSFDEDDFSDHKLLTALAEKWTSMSCHLTMWLEIQELNEAGIWVAVPLSGYNLKSLSCGGFFKIRQGQSHRIVVRVSCTKDRYSYPIKVNNILSVEAGAIRCSRLSTYGSKLDSYHDKHLELLKTEWLAALGHRRFHLESQLKRLSKIQNKSPSQLEQEEKLMARLKDLVTEQNAVEIPAAGSGIPGAPADWRPPIGMEEHIPIFFLDLKHDDNALNTELEVRLDDEEENDAFLELPILQHATPGSILAHWDPSLHDSTALNRLTDNDMFVFVVIKVRIQLSESAQCRNLVLRKRIALQITRRSTANLNVGSSIFKKIMNTIGTPVLSSTVMNTQTANVHPFNSYSCGITFELIAKLPNSLRRTESSSTLASVAVNNGFQIFDQTEDKSDERANDNSWVEEYLDCMRTVNEDFSLEYKRQLNAYEEILDQMNRKGRPKRSITQPEEKEDTDCDTIANVTSEDESTNDREERNDIDEKVETIASDDTGTIIGSVNTVEEEEDVTTIMDHTEICKRKRNRYPSKIPNWLYEGVRVIVSTNSVRNKSGNVRFIGQTDFKPGIWIGVELDTKDGRNDGVLMGTRYFTCKEDHGVFVRIDKVKPEIES